MAGEMMAPTGRVGGRHLVSASAAIFCARIISITQIVLAEPDAGIVNFYQTKDSLMGHVDRSEICATSPLVSIS